MIEVLITEDDPMVLAINRRFLEKRPEVHIGRSFSKGEALLSYLEKHEADLLYLDVYMPGMNGFDVLKEIRNRNIDIEVVMITAANDIESITKAIRLGILDYLVKPFDEERLLLSLDKYIDKCEIVKKAGKKKNPIDQTDIDRILNQKEKKYAEFEIPKVENLDKGLQPQTLEKVINFLKSDRTPLTSQELGTAIGLSRITVRKYLNYLEGKGLIDSNIDYDTGGRPRVLYFYKEK